MRIRDNQSPSMQTVAIFLFAGGYGVNFFFALALVWGSHPSLGALGCIILFALARENRRAIRKSLRGELKRRDRLLALYLAGLLSVAIAFNVALFVWWLLRR